MTDACADVASSLSPIPPQVITQCVVSTAMHQPADETRLPCHRLARTDIASDAAARAQTEQDGRRRTEVTVRGEERRLQMQVSIYLPSVDLSGSDPAHFAMPALRPIWC